VRVEIDLNPKTQLVSYFLINVEGRRELRRYVWTDGIEQKNRVTGQTELTHS